MLPLEGVFEAAVVLIMCGVICWMEWRKNKEG